MTIEHFNRANELRLKIERYKTAIAFWENCKGYIENTESNEPRTGYVIVLDDEDFGVELSPFLSFNELRGRALNHYRFMCRNAEDLFKQL